jgi:hypothetical protein
LAKLKNNFIFLAKLHITPYFWQNLAKLYILAKLHIIPYFWQNLAKLGKTWQNLIFWQNFI